MANAPLICICIPSAGMVHMEFVERMYGPLRYVPVEWATKKVGIARTGNVTVARNSLVELAMQSGADYLLWVDDDAVPEDPADPNQALKMLLDTGLDIVGALYPAKRSTGIEPGAFMDADELPPAGRKHQNLLPIVPEGDAPMPVDGTGMHFLLTSRRVFEDMRPPWFVWDEPGALSEDFYFLDRAAARGFRAHVHPKVKVSHIGTVKITSDMRMVSMSV